MDFIFGGAIIGSLIGNFGSWTKISKSELIQVIEKQINKDPAAIALLAQKNA